MSSRTACPPTFGVTLRQLRQERGLSLRSLADLAHVGKSTLSDLENGRCSPSEATARALDRTLDANGALIALAQPAVPPSPIPAHPMGRDDVDALRGSIGNLVALDNAVGAEGIYPTARRLFRAAADALAARTYQPAVERDLQAVVGELGEVAGWLAFDSGRLDDMRVLTWEALHISRLAGDRSMELLELANLAMLDIQTGRDGEALLIARYVLDQRLSPRLQGLFRLRHARALASLGQRADALREMEYAQGLILDGARESDPPWTWWIDHVELASHEAGFHRSLGDRERSVDLLQRILPNYPPVKRRDRFLILAFLLDDLVTVGAWRDAEQVMAEVIGWCGQINSPRTDRLLREAIALICRADPPPPSTLVDMARQLDALLASR